MVTQLTSGRLIVLHNQRLLGFEADGQLAEGFPSPLAVPEPPGSELRFGTLVADEEGALLAGESTPYPSAFWDQEVAPHDAMLVRYTASGELDRGFGNGGVLLTDLGLPGPSPAAAHGPAVWINGAAVDPQGRIVLTGLRATNGIPLGCVKGLDVFPTEAFLARLNPDGSLDQSFGQGGIVRLDGSNGATIPAATRIGEPILDPEGGIYFAADYAGCAGTEAPSFLAHLRGDGSADPSFGSAGSSRLPLHMNSAQTQVTRLADGRLLLFDAFSGFAMMDSDGSLDRSFGHRGSVNKPFGAREDIDIRDTAADASGRIWLTGTREIRRGKRFANELSPEGEHFVSFLACLTPAGRLDKRLGRSGIASSQFGGRSLESEANNVLIDRRGRPIVLATIFTKQLKTRALVLARYLPPR